MEEIFSLKVLMLNGSSNLKGCTYTALTEVGKSLIAEGIEYEIFNLGAKPIRDCIDCGKCRELKRCVFDDDAVNQFVEKSRQADAFVFGTPVYYSHPSGRILSFLDRVFYSSGRLFAHKPASVVVSARRAGTTASFDVLNKYLSISQMPIVTSTYWNMVHGNTSEEVLHDLEGLQIMRNLGTNMAWMLKSLEVAKAQGIATPTAENAYRTDFIR
jgi:multimeric flavodoxin WrbA